MKKALALISTLAFASAAQSDGFLSPDNELRLRPISYNPNEDSPLIEDFPTVFPRNLPRDTPRLVYVDDAEDNEQFARPNIVQNWHYPLKPITVQNQPIEKDDSADNSLFNLVGMIQNTMQNIQKEGEVIQRKQEVRGDKAKPGHSTSIYYDPDDNKIFLTVVKKVQPQRR